VTEKTGIFKGPNTLPFFRKKLNTQSSIAITYHGHQHARATAGQIIPSQRIKLENAVIGTLNLPFCLAYP
jgi:hypothetical protein